jgi:hypothetical protein
MGTGSRRSEPETNSSEEAPPRRRGMSAAGKARIAAAQRKRWANLKAAQGEPKTAKRKKAKRKLSADGRARIVAATKARWDAFRKAKGQKASKKS